MHVKSFVKRNLVEGSLVTAGVVILIAQFAVAKLDLASGGVDRTDVIGVPFDDAYIHARYAENLRAGKGYTFNRTENIDDSLYRHPLSRIVSADTSPLWVALIAIGGIFSSHLDLVAIFLSALAWLLLAPGVYRLGRYVFVWEQSISLAAALTMLLAPRLLAMALSGMETTFATLLGLIAITMHIRSREMKMIRIREGVVLGLCIAIRPEFYLLVLIAATDWIFAILKKQISAGSLFAIIIPILVFAYFVFMIPYSENGSFLYHSGMVQGAGFRFPPEFYYIGRAFYLMLENIWWIVLLLLLAASSFRFPKIKRITAILPVFMILLPIVQGFVAPQYRHFGRYEFIVFPFVILSAFALLRNTLTSSKKFVFLRSMKEPKRIVYLSVVAVIFSLPLAVKWSAIYAESVRNINDQHLAVTEWIERNTTGNDVIAAHDVGALGYFTKKNIIDLTGLVSPEFYPLQHDQSLVWKEARRKGANIFVIYRRLNPTFYEYAKDSLELIEDYRVRFPFISSADTVLSLFKAKGNAAR